MKALMKLFSFLFLLQHLAAEYCPHEEDSEALLAIETAMKDMRSPISSCCTGEFLSCLPQTGRVKSLRIMHVELFQDRNILSQVCNLTQLRKLTIGVEIELDVWDGQLPPCIEKLQKLEELHVHTIANLSDFTVEKITSLRGLKKLTLAYAGIRAAGFTRIFNLKELEYLSVVNNNPSTPIPASVCSLSKLVYLDLSSNNLSGEIPPCLNSLNHLQHLTLSNNQLQGSIPHLGNLSDLQVLQLVKYHLTGPLPAFICNITRTLNTLDLSRNHITSQLPDCVSEIPNLVLHTNHLKGTIPASLFSSPSSVFADLSSNRLTGSLPNINSTRIAFIFLSNNFLSGSLQYHDGYMLCPALKVLNLFSNQLTGSIPQAFGNCKSMTRLDVGRNQLDGKIPDTLGALMYMMDFRAPDNQLYGQIPSTIGNWSYLVTLDLRGNSLSGVLGSWIYSLKFMKILSLGSNKIGGHIPRQLGNFSSALMAVDLSNNRFRGSLPAALNFPTLPLPFFAAAFVEVSTFPFIYGLPDRKQRLYNNYLYGQAYLDVSGNMLAGTIPASIGSFNQVAYVDLSHNQLVGQIPRTLGELYLLETLDLSANNLSGPIPPELTKLTQLSSFNVTGNNLSGPVPQGSQFNTFSEDSYSGNSQLCGFPLKPCSNSGNNISRVSNDTAGAGCHLQASVSFAMALIAAAAAPLLILLLLKVLYKTKEISVQNVSSASILEGELWHATKGYSRQNVIGVGGRSTVYKGQCTDGKTVAIKVYKPGQQEFHNEYNILNKIRHRNIIRLINCSFGINFNALVLEYMINGSLDKQLHELQGVNLPWRARLNIASGVANALHYLHEEAKSSGAVTHRDLKPANVFLDEHMEAHLGDFGISTCLGMGDEADNKFKGSIGYVPPEYAFDWTSTTAGDVYSYGILLLEMLTGIRPTSDSLGRSSLRSWLHLNLLQNTVEQALDPILRSEPTSSRSIQNVIGLGLLCTRPTPAARPRMKEIAALLSLSPNPC